MESKTIVIIFRCTESTMNHVFNYDIVFKNCLKIP